MSQDAPPVADVSRTSETEADAELTTAEAGVDAHDTDATHADGGPGASERGFAIRFGSGFVAGMLTGGLVGVLLNSLPLAVFGGFILGTLVGIVLAVRS